MSRRAAIRIGVALPVAGVCLLTVAGLALRSGLAGLESGTRALEQSRLDAAEDRLAGARRRLAVADAILAPLAHTIQWLGPLGRSAASAARLSGGGKDLATGAAETVRAAQVGPGGLGTPAVLSRLDRAATHIGAAVERLGPTDDPSPLGRLTDAERRLERAARPLAARVRTAAALGALTASRGRYLLVVQNPVELRATGGLVGAFGVLDAGGGRLRLRRMATVRELPVDGRPVEAPADYRARYDRFGARRTWANANMSPDFPSSAGVLLRLYKRTTGLRLDGVVAIDAIGLSYLLETTGPVEAGGVTLTADRFVSQALVEAYRRPNGRRVDVLLAGARAGFRALATGRVAAIARAVGTSAAEGHLLLYASRPDLQRRAAEAGIDGAVARPPKDSLMVIRQNAAGNKLDYYLFATIRYDVRIGAGGTARARLDVAIRNAAPATNLPDYVIGRRLPDDPPGLARTWVSAYVPAAARLTGVATPAGRRAEAQQELGHTVYSWFHATAPGRSAAAKLELELPRVVDEHGRYQLLVQAQPTLNPARLWVRVDGTVLFDGPLLRDVSLTAATSRREDDQPSANRVSSSSATDPIRGP
jgi:hypothetical protein